MARYRGKASSEELADVERLHAEGVSVRQIAEDVFGDKRYRGRVERILARSGRPAPCVPEPGLLDVDVDALDWIELTQYLLDRTRRSWAKSGKLVRPSELRALLDVQRRLDEARRVERLTVMTRR
jgi:hypothetical protein